MDELSPSEDSMHDVEGVHEVVADPDDGFVDGIDELAKVLFLASHLNVNVDLLEHWQKVLGPEQPSHLIEQVKPLFKVIVAEWSQKSLFDCAGKVHEQVLVVLQGKELLGLIETLVFLRLWRHE